MSIVCAINVNGKSWIASDTQVTVQSLQQDMGPKWAIYGKYAIGIVGDLRAINVLQENVENIFKLKPREKFSIYNTGNKIRKILEDEGFLDDKTNESNFLFNEQDFLVATKSEIWEIGGDLSTLKIPDNTMWAIGTGRDLALGAVSKYEGNDVDPIKILTEAVGAAIKYNIYCGGEIWIKEI